MNLPINKTFADLRDELFHPYESIFNKFFDEFFTQDEFKVGKAFTTGYPKIDIYEENKEWVLQASIPGVNPDDVNLEIKENNTLVISGKMQEEGDLRSTPTYLIRELKRSHFSRSIKLPDNLDGDPTANAKDGILTLKWKMKDAATPDAVRKITINKS